MTEPIWQQLLEIARDADGASVAIENGSRKETIERAKQVLATMGYAGLIESLRGLAAAEHGDVSVAGDAVDAICDLVEAIERNK